MQVMIGLELSLGRAIEWVPADCISYMRSHIK